MGSARGMRPIKSTPWLTPAPECSMKTLYLDLVSGISGDMFLGALLDLGVDGEQLQRQLKLLPLEGYHIHIARGERGSIAGVKFDVHLEGDQDHEHHGHTH